MKKSFLIKISTLALSVCSLLCIGTACKEEHTHSYTETVTAPTCTEQGFTTHTCSCGDSYVDTYVDALGHNFVDYVSNNDATCVENGTETATCSRENCNESNTRTDENSALDHEYGQVAYTWNGNQCTATRICGRDNTHVDTETVTGAYEKDTDATCTAPEKGHYIATFENVAFTTQTTADNTAENGEELGHSFINYTYNNNATCTENGTETATCSRDNCEEPHTREKENTALGHDWKKDGNPVVNCTLSGGRQSYKCGRCTATKNEAVTTVLSGAPDTHNGLSVGDVCQHCGKEVLAKNGNSLVMKIDENNYQVEHYAGKAVGFSKYKDYIKSAYISDSVTEIGNDAFYNYSALTSVEIPNSVTKIGNYVFYGCASLTNIVIPDSVTTLGTGVFEGCTGLKTLVLGNGLTEIKEGLLSGCSALENLTIPFVGNNVTETTASRSTLFGYIFGTSSFDGGTETKQYYTSDSYETYYIPTSLKSVTVLTGNILYGAFYNYSSLTSVVIGNGVTSIGEYAFCGCSSLTNIEIPDSVTIIGDYAFRGCSSLTSVVIPDSVTSIGGGVFYNCSSLTNIEIPDSVTGIGGNAFYNCPIENATIPTWAISCIPKGKLKIVVITSGERIGGSAFKNCTSLTSIIIGDSVTSIGDDAFYGCSSLTSVKYTGDVAGWGAIEFGDIYANPMYYAKELYINNTLVTELVIPNTVTEIKANAFFYNCNGLTTVKYTGDIASWCEIEFGNIYANPMYYADELYINDILIAGELIIPDSVTSIGDSAFYNCSGLTSLVIPDNVTIIGDYAFKNCSSLTSIEIGEDVTSIGNSAFYNCRGLISVVIPDSVTSIGSSAFYGCSNLTSVVIGDSVTGIGDYAFWGCSSLTSIEIPDSVTSIGSSAFYGCSNLTSVEIGDSGTSIGAGAFYNCSSLTNIEIPDSVTGIGGNAFYNCPIENATIPTWAISCIPKGKLKIVVITSGERIGGSAFKNCTSLTSIIIGDSVTSIGDDAFYGCSGLTRITIPNSVTSIGEYAFCGCSSLTNIEIPDSVTSIGEYAFYNCSSLTEITLPFVGASKDATGYQSVFGYIFGYTTSSGSSTISGATYQYYDSSTSSYKYYHYYIPTSLKTVVITGKTLPDNAFYNCSMIESLICDNVKYIGINAFDGCVNLLPYNEYGNAYYWGYQGNEFYALIKAKDTAITYCIINDNTKIIADEAFKNCSSLKELQLPNGVTSIGKYAFNGCESLTSITIPDSVTSIVEYAFYGCSGLTSITIPDSVTSIGKYAFENCESLTSITISNSVTSIVEYAFYGCSGLTSITIPNSVTSIGKYAFYNCSSLTSIIIPDSVTSIGVDAFYNCSSLTKVNYLGTIDQWVQIEFGNHFANALYYGTLYINDINVLLTGTITINGSKIGSYAFYGCSNLTSVVIGDGVTTIGEDAFYNCSGLTSVCITDMENWCNISFGGVYANPLYYAKNLYLNNELVTELEIPNTVTGIKSYAFYGCSNLTSVLIPDSVTSIGWYAFSWCRSLKSIEIPDSVTSIGWYAFSSCTGLTKITLPFVGATKNGTSNTYFGCIFGASSYSYNDAYVPTSLKEVMVIGGTIGNNAFYSCDSLTSVVIGDGVTSIGYRAFYDCDSLTSVVIGDSVTSIGEDAFYWCSSLTSVVIGDGVTSIGSSAFEYCSSLTSVEIGDGVTSIGSSAFRDCESLTSVEIGDGVTSIGSYAFCDCDSLTSVVIGDSVTSIGGYAFYWCSSLTSITIPDSVTSIGWYAFYNCSSLKSIEIPDSVTSIGGYAFYNCSSLKSITIPDSVTTIGNYAFYSCNRLTSIIFEDTSTWYRTTSSSGWANKTGGTQTSVTASSTNAMYFKSTYGDYYWYKL